MIAAEIEIWKKLAKLDVLQAKEFGEHSNLFLIAMYNKVRDIFSKENPLALPSSDIRYRTYVVEILKQLQKQGLQNFESFFAYLMTGRLK